MKTREYFIFFLSSVLLVLVFAFVFQFGFSLYDKYLAKQLTDQIQLSNPKHIFARKVLDKILVANNKKPSEFHLIIENDDSRLFAESHIGQAIHFSNLLLESIDTEQGLAFILAHELSHMDGGHSYSFRSFALSQNWGGNDFMYARAFNHKQELEADREALKLLENTYPKLNQEEVLELFGVESKLRNDPNYHIKERSRINAINYTHPVDSKRISLIKYLINKSL